MRLLLEKRRAYFILLLLLTLVITLSALTRRAQQQHSSSTKEQQSRDNPYPVVDFLAADSTEHEKDSKRRAKGKRYNNGGVVKDGAGLQLVTRFTDWSFSVTELPTTASDVIIVGTVIEAQAYLSPDKNGVYSEFNIKVDEVLKDLTASVHVGNSVAVDREGGRVRYPSGENVTYYIEGQSVPRVNRRYVLFLKHEEQGFRILTGYELGAGGINPLDRIEKFKKHKGVDETTFLTQIRNAINSQAR